MYNSHFIPVFQNVAILVLLPFHITFRINLFISTQKSFWDFDGNCVKPVYQLRNNWYFCYIVCPFMNTACLSIYLNPWFISFILKKFLVYRLFTWFFLDLYLGGAIFGIDFRWYFFSVSICLLLVYRNRLFSGYSSCTLQTCWTQKVLFFFFW